MCLDLHNKTIKQHDSIVVSRHSKIIISFNSPKNSSPRIPDKKANYIDTINTILYATDVVSKTFSFFRIGKPSSESPRPIKLILHSPAEAKNFFRNFSSDRLKESRLSEVSISRDRTPRKGLEGTA